jgi:hypothetical protein
MAPPSVAGPSTVSVSTPGGYGRFVTDASLPERPRVFAAMHDHVVGRLDELTRSIIGELQARIPAYAGVTADALFDGVSGDIVRAIDAVATGRPPTPDELEACEEVGEQRARQGLPVEAVIQAFQVAAEETLNVASAEGERAGASAEELLVFHRFGWAWANEAMTAAARAHRRAELELARRDVHQRDELLARLVLGAASGSDVQLRIPVYGLSSATSYVVVRARPLTGGATASALVERWRRAHPSNALSGLVAGDAVALAAAPPPLTDDACGGVAGPAPLLELHSHFADASRAVDTAWAFGMPGHHRLEELGVLAAVVLDRRLGELLSARLDRLGAPADQARLAHTLEVLLDSDLSVQTAAARLFVHENTVRKRLRLAEERLGLDLRRVDDLVAVWWALRARRAGVGSNTTDRTNAGAGALVTQARALPT